LSFDRKEIKKEARLAMRDQKPSIFLIAAVYLVINFVMDTLGVKLQYPGMTLFEIVTNAFDEEKLEMLMKAGLRQNYLSKVIVFAMQIMSWVLAAGFTMTCLAVSRRQEAGFGTLLDPFAFLLKVMWLNILIAVFVTLWSILLVIPGIIAAYKYSLAVYILLDDPSKRVIDCIGESKNMTSGYKWELFVLDLSFLGWTILSLVPFVSIYSLPFMETTKAIYYNRISGCGVQANPYEGSEGFDKQF